ncbi:membrane protein [Capsulimonas corticalis]|uniref:Membrane protein n=1 Tax=Capsulimonas corticalis TaxID=2219043 RepID=A0A402CPJ6_9BACT|nr:hypothetical protein [Capsulimonas corticalis]BDI32981.1 membrane protein [Capsulimonas corticalis]
MTRLRLILLFLATLLPWTSPVQAQQTAAPASRPHILVVIADYLTLSDFHSPSAPDLASFFAQGQSAMMSPGLAKGADPISDVYATMGAGDSIRVGEVLQGSLGKALSAAGVSVTTIGDADGDDTGPYHPLNIFLPGTHNLASGSVADPLAPGGRRCDPALLFQFTKNALVLNDLVVVHDGDFARLERENRAGDLLPAAYVQHRLRAMQALDGYMALIQSRRAEITDVTHPLVIYFVVPSAPLDSHGQWNRLTPCLRSVTPPTASVLMSDTTQTLGLVAARDVAPTILAELNVIAPFTMTGAPMQASSSPVDLERLDRLTYLNQKIQLPFFWGLGFLGGGLVFFAVWFYVSTRSRPRPTAQRTLQYGVRMLAAWPAALLMAPLVPIQTPAQYLAVIAGVTAVIALLPSPAVIAIVTGGLLILDAALGTALVSQSALSAYYLSGIRFYGIGNEYMGVLLGAALITATVLPAPEGKRWPWGLRWFALVVFVLSFPAFGAKAGGAITAVLTFKVMWQKRRGRPLGAKHLLVGLAIGIGVVLFWGVIGHWIGVRRTHIDTAVGALEGQRFGYIMGVAWRKVGLALRVALHPGTLLGLAALGTLGALGCSLLKKPLLRFLERRPAYRSVLEAGVAGCVFCALVNDSGVVAAILLFITIVLPVLHDLLGEERCDLSPST